MSWAPTKITCKCGAAIETRWTSELKDWQDRHDACLVQSDQSEQDVDWEKLYRLEVKKKEALAAKYERDIKPLTKIVPKK